MGCCFIPAGLLTRLSRPPGRATSVSAGRGEWGSVCTDLPHYWPARPPLTPPRGGGRTLGLSGGVAVSAPPPVACGGQCFLWSLAAAERVLPAIFCPARQPLPLLWQRASFRTCPRFWVADFFSPKTGIYEAQSSPTALFLGFQSLHFPTSQSPPVCFLLHVRGKVCPLHLHESGGLAAIPFHQDLRFCRPGQSRQAWR